MHYLCLFITEKSGNYWHFAHIIPHAKTCGDNPQKNSKSNVTRIFAEGRQGRWIFFFKLRLKLALFMLKICLLEKYRFHLLSELYHCSEKLCHFPFDASRHPFSFWCFKASITHTVCIGVFHWYSTNHFYSHLTEYFIFWFGLGCFWWMTAFVLCWYFISNTFNTFSNLVYCVFSWIDILPSTGRDIFPSLGFSIVPILFEVVLRNDRSLKSY